MGVEGCRAPNISAEGILQHACPPPFSQLTYSGVMVLLKSVGDKLQCQSWGRRKGEDGEGRGEEEAVRVKERRGQAGRDGCVRAGATGREGGHKDDTECRARKLSLFMGPNGLASAALMMEGAVSGPVQTPAQRRPALPEPHSLRAMLVAGSAKSPREAR